MKWKNLAPEVTRQRIMIEATTESIVLPKSIKKYLVALADVADMEVLSGPFAYKADELGYGGWIHWRTSGAHVYSYPSAPPLLTIDAYTCKPFNAKKVVDFTKNYFKTIEIVFREIEV